MLNKKIDEFQLGDNTFRVEKFSPKAGIYWYQRFLAMASKQVSLTELIQQFNKDKADQTKLINSIQKLIESFFSMERKECEAWQTECLRHVYMRVATGNFFCIVDSNGEVNQPDLTSLEIYALTLKAFQWTIMEFFDLPQLERMAGQLFPGLEPSITDNKTTWQGSSSDSPSNSNTGDSVNSGTEPTT